MTMMFVILQHILCAAQDPAQHRHNDGQRTRMCSSTSNKASCNWTEHLAEQTLPTFSFNQCVGLNYDFMGFFTQVCLNYDLTGFQSLYDSYDSYHTCFDSISLLLASESLRPLFITTLAEPSSFQPQPRLRLAQCYFYPPRHNVH